MKIPKQIDIANSTGKKQSTLSALKKRNPIEYELLKIGVFCDLNNISFLDLQKLALEKEEEASN